MDGASGSAGIRRMKRKGNKNSFTCEVRKWHLSLSQPPKGKEGAVPERSFLFSHPHTIKIQLPQKKITPTSLRQSLEKDQQRLFSPAPAFPFFSQRALPLLSQKWTKRPTPRKISPSTKPPIPLRILLWADSDCAPGSQSPHVSIPTAHSILVWKPGVWSYV